ncbi:MAG: chromosome segregation protein SMC [bacterium]
MRLKFIELFGFKTFPYKVRIPFHQGINIIVGPNGCGKTNIVDAVRFILGEQNLKDLRLKNMDDIIFHGSNARNRSSVALCRGVFENDSGGSFRYKDFSEIMVERRHFKNKETEYRINGISVPYRQYLDFFNECSLSKHYSIIDSSKINAVLNYKPYELRLFFEEASGVTKYKIQKKSASKKLEAAVNNLLRIGDLFNEVNIQLSFLEKSAKKLDEYKKLETVKRQFDLALYDRVKGKITSEIDKYKKELENYYLQLAAAGAKESSILSALTDTKTSFDKTESEYKRATGEKNKYLIDLAKLNSNIEYGNMKIKNLESEILKKTQEIEEQTRSKNKNAEKLSNLKNSLASDESNLEDIRQKLNILNKSVAEKKDLMIKIKDNIEDINDEIFNIVEKSQNYNNKLLFNNKNIKNIEARISDTKNLISKISTEIKETDESLNEKLKLLNDVFVIIENLKKEYAGNRTRLLELMERLNEYGARKGGLEKELIKIDIDISKLTDFIDNREAFSEGTKNFLNAKKDYEAYPLSDLVEIESGFENAVLLGAGEILEAVLIGNTEDAEKALNYVNNNKTGEIKIFIPGKKKEKGFKQENLSENISRQLNLIPLKEKITLNRDNLFSEDIGVNFYYHSNKSDILEYIKQTGFFPEVNIITEDGVIFLSGGFIIAGKNKKIESQNLFVNKKKLTEYKNIRMEKQKEFDRDESLFNSMQVEINEFKIKIDNLGEEIKINEMTGLTVKTDIKHLESLLIKSKERLNILTNEFNNLENERTASYKEEEDLKGKILIIESESKLKSDEKNKIEKRLQDFESEFEKVKEDETTLKIEINSAEQNINFIRKQIRDLESNILNYDKRIKSLIEQKEKTALDLDNTVKDLSAKQKNIETINESLKLADVIINDTEIKLERLKESINDTEKDLENANRQKLNMDKKKDAVQTYIDINNEKLAELNSSRDLNGLSIEYTQEDKDFMDSIADIDNDGIRKRVEELNLKIKELGDINMNAAKEYGDALDRLEFLGKQKKDLENSIETLRSVIKQLDAVSKEKFNSSLSSIRQKFKELFIFLFGGGNADILNVASRNLEETDESEEQSDANLQGMEINAQIPGKKFSGINILSQGERVLVAVSLLFSIFLVKKTPFCVIDEVDAPLDYANNARYNKLIEEISNYSQIILITHNKKTMEIGKNIFGVTSKHPGISGIVSVSMN